MESVSILLYPKCHQVTILCLYLIHMKQPWLWSGIRILIDFVICTCWKNSKQTWSWGEEQLCLFNYFFKNKSMTLFIVGHKALPLVFYTFQCQPCTPEYFYPAFHYHNKTHAWKKQINSKRQGSQKSGFGRLIFIFRSCLLVFYVALFISLGEIESDMPFLSACASLWCFSGLLFCVGQAQSHAQA